MLPVLLLTALALAGAPRSTSEAEVHRLSESLEQLASKNAWTGVERTYQELVASGHALSSRDHLFGAYAARDVGDVTSARQRLVAARGVGTNDEIENWLLDIDASYGLVMLKCDPGAIELAREDLPFQPDQVAAIAFAQERLRTAGAYHGYLPAGAYAFGSYGLVVRAGGRSDDVDLRSAPTPRSHAGKGPIRSSSTR